MNSECLKLTCYFGERHRTASGFVADQLLDVFGRGELATSIMMRGVEGFGLKGTEERGVDGVVGGDLKRGRGSHPGVGEEVEERGVVLVDLAQGVLHLGEGLGEDGLKDAVLLVGEEGEQRVLHGAEEVVDEPDDLG